MSFYDWNEKDFPQQISLARQNDDVYYLIKGNFIGKYQRRSQRSNIFERIDVESNIPEDLGISEHRSSSHQDYPAYGEATETWDHLPEGESAVKMIYNSDLPRGTQVFDADGITFLEYPDGSRYEVVEEIRNGYKIKYEDHEEDTEYQLGRRVETWEDYHENKAATVHREKQDEMYMDLDETDDTTDSKYRKNKNDKGNKPFWKLW